MNSNPKVAVIDVGSNTIKLMVAQRSDSRSVESLAYLVEETRLGEGISGEPPSIDPSAMERGAQAISRLCKEAESFNPASTAVIATSAVREASNRKAFCDKVKQTSGYELIVVTGEEEANLIAQGILCDPIASDLEDFNLIDLGGGSLEFICFHTGALQRAFSMDLGCVRLTAQLVGNRNAPLNEIEAEAISNHVLDTLSANEIASGDCLGKPLILTGGSANVLDFTINGDSETGKASLEQLQEACSTICTMNFKDRIEKMEIPESRADVFPAAAITLVTIMETLQAEKVYFSRYNLRYGAAKALLETGSLD